MYKGAFLGILIAASSLSAQKFYSDDPLLREPAPRDASGAVQRKIGDYYDFVKQTFHQPGEPARKGSEVIRARDVNTLGEPMDGAWYMRRHYYERMSIEELVRGAGNENAPAADGKWKIVKAKSEGVTPGLEFVDAKGRRYVLKFDPPNHPDLATAPDVISSKFFYALGYHTPENYIVHFTPDQLELGKDISFTGPDGKARSMEKNDLSGLLAAVPKDKDGRWRGLASLYLPGKPLGAFKYYGTRTDDPNDTVLHEHRRELRGLRVFSAWLQHDDSRAINTLDMLVADGGAPYIRHHLIDFGSTLGSATYGPNPARTGFEYIFQWKPAVKQFLSLGTVVPDWYGVDYSQLPGLGHFEADKFDPKTWKAGYPNSAFLNMLPDDAFWAAKQVAAFTDEEIRAIVKTGEYSDQRVEQAVGDILIHRRDKVGRAYLSSVLALDRFAIRDGKLIFEDLEIKHGLKETRSYWYEWSTFDSASGVAVTIDGANSASVPNIPSGIILCKIADPEVKKLVQVFVRAATREVIGIERSW